MMPIIWASTIIMAMEVAENPVVMITDSRAVNLPSRYICSVASTPMVKLPTKAVTAMTADVPGVRNRGRITGRSSTPQNSSSP